MLLVSLKSAPWFISVRTTQLSAAESNTNVSVFSRKKTVDYSTKEYSGNIFWFFFLMYCCELWFILCRCSASLEHILMKLCWCSRAIVFHVVKCSDAVAPPTTDSNFFDSISSSSVWSAPVLTLHCSSARVLNINLSMFYAEISRPAVLLACCPGKQWHLCM